MTPPEIGCVGWCSFGGLPEVGNGVLDAAAFGSDGGEGGLVGWFG
jgi:hypothetical protein